MTERAFWTVFCTLLGLTSFLMGWGFGVTKWDAHALLAPAILTSGGFWTVAALLPLWFEDASVSSALANIAAASTAIYAGLAALSLT